MKSDCLIDIIIPAYKAGRTISATLDSLNLQTNKKYNVIVVLDGYDNHTYERACAKLPLCEGRKQIFVADHGGVASARNYGLEMTFAPYVMFLDADDLLLPNAIATAYSAIEQGFDFMVGKTMREAENGNFDVVGAQQMTWIHGRVYNRAFLKKYGIVFPAIPMCEDLTFNMLCAEFAEKVPETMWPIHIQRFNHGSLSRSETSQKTQALTYIRCCTEYVRTARKYRSASDLRLLPAALASSYYYMEAAEVIYANDKEVLDTMAKHFVELIDESGYCETPALRAAIPEALASPSRPVQGFYMPTLTFEQRIINATNRVCLSSK